MLTVDSGAYAALSCSSRDGLLKPVDCDRIEFSPDARKALVLKGDAFATGSPTGPFGARVTIPLWMKSEEETIGNVVFWLSERLVFVQQRDILVPSKPQCRLFDVETGQWRRSPVKCLSGDYSQIGKVEVGPGHLLAVYSGAEGMGAVELCAYDLEKGQTRLPLPSVSLTRALVSVRFAPDGSRVDLVSPCAPLVGDEVHESAECSAAPRWRLFSIPTRGGPMRLRRADLPPGAVLDPKHERFAWPRGDEICVGDPAEPRPRCVAVPTPATR